MARRSLFSEHHVHFMQPAIPTELVRRELDAVCSSATFVRSPQHQRLLRYLVEELLADRLANLREIHLGVHIFGRAAAHFDPATDSTVRVEARRLRARLMRYYANAGADARIIIELPLGSYIPTLRRIAPSQRVEDNDPLRPVIVVLPIDGLGGTENGNVAAWSDALTEEITDALARSLDVRVVARTSAMQFKNVRRDIREIATTLSADILIEGSLQQENDQLRAIVQIVAANDGLHLWSDSVIGTTLARFHFFDTVTAMVRGALPAVIATVRHPQADNAAIVADDASLRPQNRAVASTSSPPAPAVSETVRDMFERGNIAIRVRTTDSIARATALFLQVTTDAPEFARGHAAYAIALLQQVGMTMRAASDAATLMRSACAKALALDPQLPEAHATLGMFSFYYEHDWASAERELLRAIHFGPSYVSAHRSYAFGLMFMRRFDEAERNFANARALDPLDAQTRVNQGVLRLYQRRFNEAREVFDGMLEADSNNVIARTLLAYTCLHSGDATQAERHYREAIVRHPDLSIGHCGLAVCLALVGRVDEAKHSQAALVNYARTAFVSPYQFAMIECVLGNDLAALNELERAAIACDYNFLCSAVDPIFDRLHGTAGWTSLMRRFGLPEH